MEATANKGRGRPATGQAMTAAERKRKSREMRMSEVDNLQSMSVTALLELYPKLLRDSPRLAITFAHELTARAEAAYEFDKAKRHDTTS